MGFTNKDLDVKPYQFGKLKPSDDVKEFEEGSGVRDFKMKSLKDAASFNNEISEDIIRTERKFEKEKSFSILPLIREHRGLVGQEDQDIEEAIQNEVEKRINELYENTRSQAYQEGHQEGYEKAYSEGMRAIDDKIEDFIDLVNNVKSQTHEIIEVNKKDSLHMIKNLVKWISLKEIEDEAYLSRLLEKLIHEMNTKNNLLVRVNQESFKYMPDVIEKVQARVGELPNLRIEVDLDQDEKGIILESENGIIDASLNAQFKSLDKIFEVMDLNE